MKIAVLSGKGGTGKTLVSVNLAAVANKSTYIDCDVEEPNGNLFFKSVNNNKEDVTVKIPDVDQSKCSGCRKCIDFCKFNALAYIKEKVVVFDNICHSCGGCVILCPENAITEKERIIGKIIKGNSDKVTVHTGLLNTGEESGVPIIKKLIENNSLKSSELIVIDCPPGSACIVMESIKDADYCILVAEPTIFGVHNLNMVYELVKLFNKPFGVIINKFIEEDNPVKKFCIENNIKILGKIPFEDKLGSLNSNGKIAVRQSEKYNKLFNSLLEKVKGEVQNEATSSS